MTIVPVPVSAPAVREAAAFLERFGGIAGFLESLLAVPNGYLQHWSQENLIRWYYKLEDERAVRSKEGRRPIPPSLLMPALQKIATEDGNDMLGIWARLFANFEDATQRIQPRKVYVSLLSEMQPLDVVVLQRLTNLLVEIKDEGNRVIPFLLSRDISSDLQISEADLSISVHNLSRLSCLLGSVPEVQFAVLHSGAPSRSATPSIAIADGTYFLTSLGSALVAAVTTARRE